MIRKTAIQISHCSLVMVFIRFKKFIFKFTKLFEFGIRFSIIRRIYLTDNAHLNILVIDFFTLMVKNKGQQVEMICYGRDQNQALQLVFPFCNFKLILIEGYSQ
jgi:hypothetical protein